MNALPADRDQLATKADIAELRAELYHRIGEQTRTLVLAVAGLNLSAVGLAFAAARLA